LCLIIENTKDMFPLPAIPPSKNLMSLVNRKRKKPERDFIDELLGEEKDTPKHQFKRSKVEESASGIVALASGTTSETQPKDIYQQTGGLVIQVG